MVQWTNVFRNNSFVNPMRLPLLRRNSRAVALAEAGLTAGWLAGWLIDEMWVNFKFLKFIMDRIFILFTAFNKATALSRLMVVSRKAKKKQHAHTSSSLCDHYSE